MRPTTTASMARTPDESNEARHSGRGSGKEVFVGRGPRPLAQGRPMAPSCIHGQAELRAQARRRRLWGVTGGAWETFAAAKRLCVVLQRWTRVIPRRLRPTERAMPGVNPGGHYGLWETMTGQRRIVTCDGGTTLMRGAEWGGCVCRQGARETESPCAFLSIWTIL